MYDALSNVAGQRWWMLAAVVFVCFTGIADAQPKVKPANKAAKYDGAAALDRKSVV